MIRARQVEATAVQLVHDLGQVFTVFDERSQDSGHISYGVDTGAARLFVKTSGGPQRSPGGLSQAQRADVLRRAASVHGLDHPALITLHELIETSDGVAMVHDWFDGELLRAPRELRQDPAQAHNRFKRLPTDLIVAALDRVVDLHVLLEESGWVLGDFYDGCLMYDFDTGEIRVMDFECYQRGPYRNDRGRLPGSTRFMAPEEFRRGALIDSRTTVFNLARMIEIFYLSEHPDSQVSSVVARATAPEPGDRPATAAQLQRLWRDCLAVPR